MESKYKGLTLNEAKDRQKLYGLNVLVKEKKSTPLKKFIEIFKEPMFLLLIIAASIYFLLGEPKEGAVMLVFVFFVAGITFVQEWKTEKTMEALKDLTSPQVTALRDGEETILKSSELVPGDIIFLSEGERIPADCKVLEASNFSVDESILTGESEPVYKEVVDDDPNSYWKKNILYAGTLSIFGKGVAEVILTGFNTEYGKIGKAVSEAQEQLTPLQRKVSKLVKSLAVTGLILCVLVVVVSYLYNGNILNSILSGVSLAMAIIPEEFPVVLTIFLSMGAYRLAKKNTLMRKISAVETLGSATVLCVDKTGTITKNLMSVEYIYCDGKLISKNSFDNEILGRICVLSCEKDPYDPMEKAMVEVGQTCIDIESLNKYQLINNFPFDSKTKRMANVFKNENNYYVALKGSAESVLPLCSLTDGSLREIESYIDIMASKGLRILAMADCISTISNENIEEYNFKFQGLIGLQDPPKDGVREAINICKKAGIRVIMITGDYSKTAIAIGDQIGLQFSKCSLTGDDIESFTDDELSQSVQECDVFSRVIPEHKMKIINALRRNGDIVAMTGDGVNDAPALKSADIGIAMGNRGTEVAKEAAHMVLMDDNFTTIVKSVEDGRRVYDNIRKAMVYILIIHIPIAALALFAPIFNLPQMLLPMHIMLLELIIDPTCSIVFEGEPAEPYIMEQPPRDPKEPLLNTKLTIKVMLQGLTMFLATFMSFHIIIDTGSSVAYARSFSLIVLIIANIALVLVNRSNTEYLTHIFKEKKSYIRVLINGIALLMLIAIIYIPFVQSFFQTTFVDFSTFLVAAFIGFVSTAWWELVKVYNNRKYKLTS